jgi:hypothetical protein
MGRREVSHTISAGHGSVMPGIIPDRSGTLAQGAEGTPPKMVEKDSRLSRDAKKPAKAGFLGKVFWRQSLFGGFPKTAGRAGGSGVLR